MSRSYKKTPMIGHTAARSEKQDKRLANRKFRRLVREHLAAGTEPPFCLRQVSNVYGFAKDGKGRFSVEKYLHWLRK